MRKKVGAGKGEEVERGEVRVLRKGWWYSSPGIAQNWKVSGSKNGSFYLTTRIKCNH
jgi:hypothetical protein